MRMGFSTWLLFTLLSGRAPATHESSPVRLAPGDVVHVEFQHDDRRGGCDLVVRGDGSIGAPLYGRVRVSGLDLDGASRAATTDDTKATITRVVACAARK